MTSYFNKRTLGIVGTTVFCILILWIAGFGFGNETRISKILGVTFLGSDLYLGTWFIFVLIIPVGFGIPYFVIRFVLHERIQDYGFTFGDLKLGVICMFAMIPGYIFMPLTSAFFGTEHYYTYLTNPDFLKPVRIAIHFVSYAGFILGFEFLFRGFTLFGLNRAMGDTNASRWIAIMVSCMLSTMSVIGLPWIFPVCTLLLGIFGCVLNFRTRSFIYFAFISWLLGVWSDTWEIIKLNIGGGIW